MYRLGLSSTPPCQYTPPTANGPDLHTYECPGGNTIFKASSILNEPNLNKPNIGMLRVPIRLESKVPAPGGTTCEKKCVPPRFQKIKRLQEKYQAKDCPVWRMGLMDNLLYYLTMTGCLAGPALAIYNIALMI